MVEEAEQLTPQSLEKYFLLGAVSVFDLSLEVDARLEIDPTNVQLRLFVPARGGLPDITEFERIRVERIEGAGASSRYCLTFDARQMHYAAYQLVESIVSCMRKGGSFGHAVLESIAEMEALLASRSRLSEEEEVGLWGELLLLEQLISRGGERLSLEAWLGPANSEHDFSLGEFEVEVKTTRSETRRHRIGSDTQLQSSPGRPLYLVSIQTTLAGAADEGRTLPELIDAVRTTLSSTSARFEDALRDLRYYDRDADLYQKGFQLRTKPRAYLVDDLFPAVTRERLEAAVPSFSLVSEVSYRIDVGSLPHVAIPFPLDQFCEVSK